MAREIFPKYIFIYLLFIFVRDADVSLFSFLQQLKKAGKACVDQKKSPPNLIVVVLPEGGNDIYTAVKK